MRLGLAIECHEKTIYVRFDDVEWVIDRGLSYEVKVTGLDRPIDFTSARTFQILKNYVVMGHPVVDHIDRPNVGK